MQINCQSLWGEVLGGRAGIIVWKIKLRTVASRHNVRSSRIGKSRAAFEFLIRPQAGAGHIAGCRRVHNIQARLRYQCG